MEPKKSAPTPPPTVPSSTPTGVALPGNHEEKSDYSDDDEDVGKTVHTLPFKVLGTCHSTSRQVALQEAFECMYGQNGQIYAKLKAEPSNTFDSPAIAVFIKTEVDYKKVGYLPSDLTKF